MELHSIARSGASGPHDQCQDDDELIIHHKAKALIAGLLLSLIMLIVAAGACYGGMLLLKSHAYSNLGPAAFIAAAFFLVSTGAAPIVMFREGCLAENADHNCKVDCDHLAKALNGIPNSTLSGLAKANFRQMR